MLDLDAINADPMLQDSPLGDLKIVMWGGEPAVAVINRHDPERLPHILHMVADGGVLSAMYGKRFWEQGAIQAAYDKAAELRTGAYERDKADRGRDAERDFLKFIRKEGARDEFLSAFAGGS